MNNYPTHIIELKDGRQLNVYNGVIGHLIWNAPVHVDELAVDRSMSARCPLQTSDGTEFTLGDINRIRTPLAEAA